MYLSEIRPAVAAASLLLRLYVLNEVILVDHGLLICSIYLLLCSLTESKENAGLKWRRAVLTLISEILFWTE